MPGSATPEGRVSKRVLHRERASVVVNLHGSQKRLPCLILDSSKDGFRLRGTFHLKRGQVVELILDEEPLSGRRCSVVWIGKAGSKHEGEFGLEAV